MTTDLFETRRTFVGSEPLWIPSQRLRTWLLIGMAALLVDLGLGIGATVLELRHWGRDGLTPDVVLSYLAILPQMLISAAYFALAREAASRSLWKSTAGLLASYLLISLLGLAFLEVLTPGWRVAVTVAVALGIVSLLIFMFSKAPRFAQETPAAPPADSALEEPEESEGTGCLVHIAVAAGVLLAKAALRRGNRWFPNIGLGLDDWAAIEFMVLAVVGLGFAIWFSLAKIGLREKLGGPAVLVGGGELVVLLIHLGMVCAGVGLLVSNLAANPQWDDADFDKLFDPWLRQATVVSAVCHGVWVLLTASLFAALWMRAAPDWREELSSLASATRPS